MISATSSTDRPAARQSERMTSLEVTEVNISVDDIHLPDEAQVE